MIKASRFFRSASRQESTKPAATRASQNDPADSQPDAYIVEDGPDDASSVETMDLETILSSSETAHGAVNPGIVAEMSAAAEEFVSDQQHHGHAHTSDQAASSAGSITGKPTPERRRKHRALISAPIRVRGVNVTSNGPDEVATTVDVSRVGILLHTGLDSYYRAMEVAVVFPYSDAEYAIQTEQIGRVARITDLGNGTRAVAIALGTLEDIATSGPALSRESLRISTSTGPETKKPLVVTMDRDEMLRDTLKNCLQSEGYDVIAVTNASDAREVLNMFTPALIVAEIEGDGNPGYDICTFVKASPRLRQVPVVLTTSSAYPSDYSKAHALGAVVCMAKPYKQDRMGHIVRLLAPLPEHLQKTSAPRPADPTRVPGRDCTLNGRMQNIVRGGGAGKRNNGNGKSRFKFPSFR
jgi:CheY-like chemotaxis protein